MTKLKLLVETLDSNEQPFTFQMALPDLEKVFESWLIAYGDRNPSYAAEMGDPREYGVRSAAEFLELARRIVVND